MRCLPVVLLAFLGFGPVGAIVVDDSAGPEECPLRQRLRSPGLHTIRQYGLRDSSSRRPLCPHRGPRRGRHRGGNDRQGAHRVSFLRRKPRRHWKAIHPHPKAVNPRLSRVWDAALIELDTPVPAEVVAGVPLTREAPGGGLAVHLLGYGQQGNGVLGDFRPPGKLSHGRNFFDQRPTPSLLASLGLPEDCGPLLIHRFDPDNQEGHFAPGDSGGPGLLIGSDGRVRIASLNLGRHRGPSDHDHRLNGSFGELGLSLDASSSRPWVQPFLSKHQ